MKPSKQTLVVVATNNGLARIEALLDAPGIDRYPLCLVDTGSTDHESREYLCWLSDHTNIQVAWTPYRGYDTGAYLWAYWQRPQFDHYLFLQDSMLPRDADFVEQMFEPMNMGGAVGWVGFDYRFWDSVEQQVAINYHLSRPTEPVTGGLPACGIFGPNFLASRHALDRLASCGLLPTPPSHKEMAQGWERGWALAFHRANVPMRYFFSEEKPRKRDMAEGRYPIFTKTFGGRS